MADEQNTQQQEAGKVEKEFNNTVDSISAIIGKPLPKRKLRTIAGNKVTEIAEKLIKKQEDKLIEEVESELEVITEAYVQMNAEIAKSEKELQQLKEKKMKEFTEAAKKTLGKVEGLGEIRKSYEAALTAGTQRPADPTT